MTLSLSVIICLSNVLMILIDGILTSIRFLSTVRKHVNSLNRRLWTIGYNLYTILVMFWSILMSYLHFNRGMYNEWDLLILWLEGEKGTEMASKFIHHYGYHL